MNKPNKSLMAAIHDYKEFNHLLGICPITGIAVEMKIPVVDGLEFVEYRSPFSYPATAEKLALTEQKELNKLPTEIQTGILLSLLHHKRLIDSSDKTSAMEKNIIIRNNLNAYGIIESIKRVVRIPRKDSEILPHLSFEAFLHAPYADTLGSIQANILEHLQGCLAIVYPSKELSNVDIEAMDAILAVIPDKKKLNVSDINKQAKFWTKNLIAQNVASPKLVNFLKNVFVEENIIATGTKNRNKAILLLALLDCHNANEIIKLIKIVESYDAPTEDRGGELDLTISQQAQRDKELQTLQGTPKATDAVPETSASSNINQPIITNPAIFMTAKEKLLAIRNRRLLNNQAVETKTLDLVPSTIATKAANNTGESVYKYINSYLKDKEERGNNYAE